MHLSVSKKIIRRKIWSTPVSKIVIAQVESIAKHEGMLKGLEINKKHRRTLFDASYTTGVDYADDTKNNNTDSSEDKSNYENSEIELNTNNSNNNSSKNLEQNDNNEELNLDPTLNAYAESKEVISMSENDDANNDNIHETINVPEQDFNLSSHRRPICIRRTAERCGSFIYHAIIQVEGTNKYI